MPITRSTSGLSPYLVVKGAAEAIAFYQAAFGAREIFRLNDPASPRIGHAELEIGGSRLMLSDEYPDFGALGPVSVGGSPVALHLYVEDADATVERATSAGATVLRAVKREFHGDRSGMIVDPFGHKWHVSTREEEVSPEEMQRRWNAMTG